jgi:hypothetical protein
MSHDAFSNGREAVLLLQRKLKRPPKRSKIAALVHTIVKQVGLRHDVRRRYFELLATCALMGREPMYNAYQPKHKRRIHDKN